MPPNLHYSRRAAASGLLDVGILDRALTAPGRQFEYET